MFSGKPASNGPGRLEDDLLLLWKLESTLFLPHAVVCLAPQCLYIQGIYHRALGAAGISTDCWEPAPLLNSEDLNSGSTNELDISLGHCAKSLSEQVLGCSP